MKLWLLLILCPILGLLASAGMTTPVLTRSDMAGIYGGGGSDKPDTCVWWWCGDTSRCQSGYCGEYVDTCTVTVHPPG